MITLEELTEEEQRILQRMEALIAELNVAKGRLAMVREFKARAEAKE